MKLIRRTMTKREHKLVDYDRFRISLKKLQDKKERTLNDEKQIYKVRTKMVLLNTIGSVHITCALMPAACCRDTKLTS